MPVFIFEDFELDPDAFELRRNGSRYELGVKPFELLAYLVRHHGRLISIQELIQRVWQVKSMSPSTVPTSIAAIRKALDDTAKDQRLIETVRGRGYRFRAKVTVVQNSRRGLLTETTGSPPFVGRERELGILQTGLQLATEGTAQSLFVLGEAGIGKSRLLAEFSLIASANGCEVISARCREDFGAPALWPWVQLLRVYQRSSLAPSSSSSRVNSLLERINPPLTSKVAEANELSSPPGGKAQFPLFDAIAQLVLDGTHLSPIVLAFDDLDRADATTLHLLDFVSDECQAARLAIIATIRDPSPSGPPQASRALAKLLASPTARLIRLPGLSRAAIATLVTGLRLTSNGSVDTMVAQLYEKTNGNPFFLTRLIHLFDSRTSETDDRPLPKTVREAVLRQTDALLPRTLSLLEIGAIEGREFSIQTIALVSRSNFAQALADLDLAISTGLIEPTGDRSDSFRFTHSIVRDALYERLPGVQRAALHLELGRSMHLVHGAYPYPHSAELAHHFLLSAQCGGADDAFRFSEMAGDWASRQLAYEEAPKHYRRALDVLDLTSFNTPATRCRALLALGRAELRAEDRVLGRHTLQHTAELARSIGDSEMLALAALGLAPGPLALEVGVYDALLISLLKEALSAVSGVALELRAQLMSRLSLALVWGSAESERFELAQRGLHAARSTGRNTTIAQALLAWHGVLAGPRRLPTRLQVASEMGQVASDSADEVLQSLHRILRITDLLEKGEIASVDQEINNYAQHVKARRQPHLTWYVGLFYSMRALMSGSFQAANQLADEFRRVAARVNDQNAVQAFGAQQVIHLWEQARLEEATALVDGLVGQFPLVPGWRSTLAFVYSEAGRFRDARREIEKIAELGFERIPRNEIWNVTVATLAVACAAVGDKERSRQLYNLMNGSEQHFVVLGFGVACLGATAWFLALLAKTLERWEEAEHLFLTAARRNYTVGALPWIAHARYQHALMLYDRGRISDRKRAQGFAEEAAGISRQLGMRNLTEKALALSFR